MPRSGSRSTTISLKVHRTDNTASPVRALAERFQT